MPLFSHNKGKLRISGLVYTHCSPHCPRQEHLGCLSAVGKGSGWVQYGPTFRALLMLSIVEFSFTEKKEKKIQCIVFVCVWERVSVCLRACKLVKIGLCKLFLLYIAQISLPKDSRCYASCLYFCLFFSRTCLFLLDGLIKRICLETCFIVSAILFEVLSGATLFAPAVWVRRQFRCVIEDTPHSKEIIYWLKSLEILQINISPTL